MTEYTKYFGVVGERDYIKIEGERVPFWKFLDFHPDGWLTSLAYHRDDIPTTGIQMWDCGAWSYRKKSTEKIKEEGVSAEWALEEYADYAADGAFVVAPDHMLIPEADDLDERRKFNRETAENFLPLARKEGFRPVAAIHGMDLDERVAHSQELLDMGYEALALGGLAARASDTRRAIEAVEQIRDETRGAWLHILGLSSPPYLEAWDRIGVDSCDGASHFTRAFKAGDYYVQKNGELVQLKAARVDRETKEPTEEVPDYRCECQACRILRGYGIDTRTYGSNENNMGRAAHNLNMLMRAHRARRSRTVFLVSCVSEKKRQAAKAKALYQSQWFRFARQYVELNGDEWNILSAEHGLLDPEAIVEPYDVSLNSQGRAERKKWSERVAQQIETTYDAPTRFVFLAGRKYREDLIPVLHQRGHVCEVPMRGLGIGEQLGWLKQNAAKQQDFFEEEKTAV
jgi:hypothetical protein